MSGRMSQARKYENSRYEVIIIDIWIVGLGVDCSPWVKSGLITRDEMLDRNWAHWTTFSNVCPIGFVL
jgi:hypothetical protein